MANKKGKPQDQDEGYAVGTSEYEGGEPATAGWHRFVFAEVVDLGMDDKFGGTPDHRGVLIMQLDEEYGGEGDLAGKPKEARVYFSFSRGLGAVKSSRGGTDLRKRLQEWRGKKWTEAELQNFLTNKLPLGKLVGREGMVMTVVAESSGDGDKTYTKVVTLAPAPKSAKDDPMAVTDDYVPFHQREKRGKYAPSAVGSKRGGKGYEPDDAPEGTEGADDEDELPF